MSNKDLTFDMSNEPEWKLWYLVREACRIDTPTWRAFEVLYVKYGSPTVFDWREDDLTTWVGRYFTWLGQTYHVFMVTLDRVYFQWFVGDKYNEAACTIEEFKRDFERV